MNIKPKSVDNHKKSIISKYLEGARPSAMSRFEWIYNKNESSSKAWDQDLTPKEEFVTIPSLGSIVSNWLLFLPRQPVVNLASLDAGERVRLLQHAKDTMNDVCDNASDTTLAYFEHGASQAGAVNGCGVDHAHLHAVELPFKLRSIFEAENSNVQHVPLHDPWSEIRADDYLLCIDSSGAIYSPVTTPVSQYFRKLIAAHLGRDAEWNYNQYPFYDNISATLRNFHAAG